MHAYTRPNKNSKCPLIIQSQVLFYEDIFFILLKKCCFLLHLLDVMKTVFIFYVSVLCFSARNYAGAYSEWSKKEGK